jgi:circadian clock protein KaiC
MKRVPTGINGFDDLTDGGFPLNTVNLVGGPAGSAKSIFCMQYLYNGAVKWKEKGIFVAIEDSRSDIKRAMQNFGMDIEELESSDMLQIIDLGEMRREYNLEKARGMLSLATISEIISAQLDATKAKRVVVDSLSAAGLFYRSPEELREEMFTFCRDLKEKNVTSLVTTESIEGKSLTRYEIEQFVTDSFIVLGLEPVKGELRRTITIRKMRYTRHDTARHPFLIGKNGIEVIAEEKVF